MKSATCAILIVLLLTPAFSNGVLDTIEDYLESGYEHVTHEFGGIQLLKESEGLAESVVYWPDNGYLSEASHFLDIYTILIDSAKNPEKYKTDPLITCTPGPKSDYFKFAPYLVGSAKLGETLSITSPCFTTNTVTLRMGNNGNSVILEHNTSNASSFTCGDTFLYANTQNYHIGTMFFSGVHRTTFSDLTDYQMKEIKRSGIQLFRVCDSLANTFPSIFKTVLLFAGGLSTNPWLPFIGSHTPFWQVSANIEFIKHSTGYEWKKRANRTNIDLDAKHIKSGDFLAVTRFDGIDQIIEWGAGSRSGHSVVALWIDNELQILESQAGWYWPRANIQRNPYKKWLEWADNADFHVTVLPLKPEIQAQFNETAAYEWFKTVEGLPYGFHNFLFGWIDTEADSYPPILHPEAVAPAMAIVQSIFPSASVIFNEAINFRLNTTNFTIPQLAEVVYDRNLTWGKVLAMPERDYWQYSDGYSMVCSSFVVALWRAGGLFGDMEIHATEFTPRDCYSLTFIDPNPVLPQECKDNDPNNSFCQLMGTYLMEFPQLSTVDPYPFMNERCRSRADEDFYRPTGC